MRVLDLGDSRVRAKGLIMHLTWCFSMSTGKLTYTNIYWKPLALVTLPGGPQCEGLHLRKGAAPKYMWQPACLVWAFWVHDSSFVGRRALMACTHQAPPALKHKPKHRIPYPMGDSYETTKPNDESTSYDEISRQHKVLYNRRKALLLLV